MTERRRVLWVTNIATPYRAPLWAELAQRHDLQVALLADDEPRRGWTVELSPAVRLTRLRAVPLARSTDATFYAPSWRLLSLISRRPDVVVLDGWESPAYLAARWWARRRGVPAIASYRSTRRTHRHHRGPVAWARRWFFNGVDGVLTAGRASTEAVRDHGVAPELIAEGFNTVDVARFAPLAQRTRTAGDRAHSYLYVGQLIRRKNVDALLRAFSSIRRADDPLSVNLS